MMVTIKCFGREPVDVPPTELDDMLQHRYAGEHIALHWVKVSTGMKRLMMVSMTDEGNPQHSHTGRPVDLTQVFTEMGITPPHVGEAS